MTVKPVNPTAEAMKRALAAKKDSARKGEGPVRDGPMAIRGEEKAMAARSVALAKPAFRKASKRG